MSVNYVVKNGIGHVEMNEPDRLNALDIPMVEAIHLALDKAESDRTVKIVLLSGAGKAFCAGGNVQFFHDAVEREAYDEIDDIVRAVGGLIHRMLQYPKLIIGAVHGHAVGGGANLMLACDLVVADEKTKFSEIFTHIGLATDSGGMYLLSKAIGSRKALSACLFGTTWNGDALLELGLIHQLVPTGMHVEVAYDVALELAEGPLKAYEAVKQEQYAANYADFQRYSQHIETPLVCETLRSHDFKEAVTAFVEKRKPKFKGC